MADNEARRSPRGKIKLAVGVLLLLGLSAGVYWYTVLRGTVYSDDARIDADLVDLAPELSGTLEEVLVQEGDRVKRGQPLFRLDHTLLEAAQAKARAQLLAARAALSSTEAGYDKARRGPRAEEIRMASEAVKRAEAEARLANTNWLRARKLRASHAMPEAEVDRARTRWETAGHAQKEAVDRLRLLRRGTRREDREAARAGVAAAKARIAAADAALHQARIRLARAEVRAPFDGVVVRRWRNPGAMLAPGVPVLTLLNPATLHVAANVEEKYLDEIAAGDPVEIEVDAFPRGKLHGRVTRILRVTNSKFSLIPAEGVSGTFIKVAQRVPIRIAFDSPPDLPLGPGLSVEVRIKHLRDGPALSATTKN